MAPALAPKALERVGVSPVGCTLMPSISFLAVLSLVSTYCSPCPTACRWAAVWGSLSKTGLAIMGAGAARSTPVCLSVLSHGLSLSLRPFGALAELLPCAISLAICWLHSVVPFPESVVTAALALSLSQTSLFSLSALWVATINWE